MAISGSAHPGDPSGDPPGEVASSGPRYGRGLSLGAQELPLLDVSVLEDLEEQLGQPDIAWNFASDYVSMWGCGRAVSLLLSGGKIGWQPLMRSSA
ncbi:hypothetical protein AHiyo8_46440 [Arthrobacter sp. Hiyo8]|nr:hypothetical protein AHiyo8_46440 [Arthrobacter sp. Hiyo8]